MVGTGSAMEALHDSIKLSVLCSINGIHTVTGWPYARTFGQNTFVHMHTLFDQQLLKAKWHTVQRQCVSRLSVGGFGCVPNVTRETGQTGCKRSDLIDATQHFFSFSSLLHISLFVKPAPPLMAQCCNNCGDAMVKYLVLYHPHPLLLPVSLFISVPVCFPLSLVPSDMQWSPLVGRPPLFCESKRRSGGCKKEICQDMTEMWAFYWSLKRKNNHITQRRHHAVQLESMEEQG